MDEFVFRSNRRRSRSRGLVFSRVVQLAVEHDPVRYRDLSPTPDREPDHPSAAGNPRHPNHCNDHPPATPGEPVG
jgi:hypothetical protein